MGGHVSFPLFVFEKDDCSMFLVETPDKVLYHMEPIDIENGEYVYWDSNGNPVRISVAAQRVTGIDYGAAQMPLAERSRVTLTRSVLMWTRRDLPMKSGVDQKTHRSLEERHKPDCNHQRQPNN
jgi:hypothetical protein